MRAQKGKIAPILRRAKKAVAKQREIDTLMQGIVLINDSNEVELDASADCDERAEDIVDKLEHIGDMHCEDASPARKRRGIEFYQLALTLIRRHGYSHRLSPIYSSIALTYVELSMFDEALDYFHRQLDALEEQDDATTASIHLEIAQALVSKGSVSTEASADTEALVHYQQALDLLKGSDVPVSGGIDEQDDVDDEMRYKRRQSLIRVHVCFLPLPQFAHHSKEGMAALYRRRGETDLAMQHDQDLASIGGIEESDEEDEEEVPIC
jgi:tetratricopeptide (TPR) repeat protein